MSSIISLNISVALLEELNYRNSLTSLANLIDKTLCDNEDYEKLHSGRGYKPYTFSNFRSIEDDKKYKTDKIHQFYIRTLDAELAEYLLENISDAKNNQIKVITADAKIIQKRLIDNLYTLSPVVVKTEKGGYWREHWSLDRYEKAIKENMIKKFNYFKNTKIEENFDLFTEFKILNKKPVAVPYKNKITFLGDKLDIKISSNKTAQDIAFMTLATGIGELGARGCGFANYNWIR